MTDFNIWVNILRGEMVSALKQNPEQLAYVLMELAEDLPGTWAMDELLEHLGNTDSACELPDAAAFFRQLAVRLMRIEHK